MFFYRGDQNFRHNVPPHPVFSLPVAVLAFLGMGIMLREWRRPRSQFWFLWIGCMLLPMLLSTESPHFFRSAGVLPLAFVLPAMGLDQIGRLAEQRGRRLLGLVAVGLTLAFSLGDTLDAYFGASHTQNSGLYYAFAGQDMDLAVDINQFLGVGWQGAGWLAKDTTPLPGHQVWMDRQFWSDGDRQRTLRLLVPLQMDATSVFGFIQTALEAPGSRSPEATNTRLIVVPGQEQPAVELLPHNRLIRVEDGPLTPHGPQAPLLYRTYTATRPESLPAKPVACFEEGIELLAADLHANIDGVAVNLTWHAQATPSYDYTIFTHVVAQSELVGQVDGYPALGRYLTSWWRPGDVIADERVVPIPAGTALEQVFVRVGLYRLDTRANLVATDCAGTALGDFILLPLTGPR